MNPRSRLVCEQRSVCLQLQTQLSSHLTSPPQEYTALHQQGKRVGSACPTAILPKIQVLLRLRRVVNHEVGVQRPGGVRCNGAIVDAKLS